MCIEVIIFVKKMLGVNNRLECDMVADFLSLFSGGRYYYCQ